MKEQRFTSVKVPVGLIEQHRRDHRMAGPVSARDVVLHGLVASLNKSSQAAYAEAYGLDKHLLRQMTSSEQALALESILTEVRATHASVEDVQAEMATQKRGFAAIFELLAMVRLLFVSQYRGKHGIDKHGLREELSDTRATTLGASVKDIQADIMSRE